MHGRRCSTTGDGDVPDTMMSFWRFLLRRDLSPQSLSNVKCAVFGLGDSAYAQFNVVARKLHARLRQLGGIEFHPIVLGDDQILTCEEMWFDKPVGQDGLRTHLRQLEGRSHELANAAVVMQGDTVVWQHQDSITMVMRQLSDVFIDEYINDVGETAYQSVGGYQLEGMGAQLLDRADGDFFSILGLPLLSLLAFLRDREMVAS